MVWVKFGLFVVSVFILMFILNKVMTKLLKVDKKIIFSNNHVNKLHKKIDWILRISCIIIIFVSNMRQFEDPELAKNLWYFLGPVMIFFVLDALVRAFMEWKYATNRKDYIYTISEMILMLILIFAFVQTDFLGLIN